ncbi:carbohydrate ABC transporter substrate-binding protein, CUT1 family [Paramicrobacterium humi]|uniref:Carbohydrate ABC transporter substrate-binding protein, CUT1 family n=1 Tax=Paramicrobacterium humi TaxID=640635 RepID=A0A1H4L056_9MICO|nr:ABC transporter substrate-binding protein [Microbacterium humi]SEB64150.1 carbohydrate ABC transporter substrate-binding protein, CUT1 family [Microbacterium humi]
MSPHTQLKRSIRISAALAAVGALALSGCSGGQGATTLDKDAKVTITMWSGQTDEAQDYIKKLASEFEDEHPNVTIDLSAGASSTEQLLQKLSAGFAGNSYPDISYAFGAWASQLEASGRTLDITDQVSEPDVKWDEFSEAARATVQPTGEKTIGFPAIVDNLSLIYNKTLFDKAGLDYPDESWDWSDFREAAKKLTDPASNTYGYGYSVSGSEETTWQFWPHLWQNGGSILTDDQSKAAFDSDAGVTALTFLQDMAVTDKSVYLDQTDTKFGQLFASDRIGMITSGPWQLYDLKAAGTDYGVTVLPGTDGDHQTVSGPDIWALFDHKDKNREYWAYQFIEWLTSAEQDVRWNVAIGNLPLRSSEVSSDAFAKQAAEYPGLDVMAANNENAVKARPTVPGYVNLSEAIGGAISSVLQGQGDPADALKAAAEKSNKKLGASK